jgi:predicted nucleic acid-binding Zn ribbon protein
MTLLVKKRKRASENRLLFLFRGALIMLWILKKYGTLGEFPVRG